MRITPLDIRKQEFRKAMRGLDAEEVYAFLATVGDEYEAILNENKALRERVLELDDKVHEYRSMEKTLRDTLLTAERVTVDAKDNARREANLIIKEAQIEAEKALRDIKSQAMRLRQEVSQLRGQRESYLGRMKVIAESLLNFIQSVEVDFNEEDEAFQAELPSDDHRSENRMADQPAENGNLFDDAKATDSIPGATREAPLADRSTTGAEERDSKTEGAASKAGNAPDTVRPEPIPVDPRRTKAPGVPPDMRTPGVVDTRDVGRAESRREEDTAAPDTPAAVEDSAPSRALADGDVSGTGQPDVGVERDVLREPEGEPQTGSVLENIDAIIERMAKGQKEILRTTYNVPSEPIPSEPPNTTRFEPIAPTANGPIPSGDAVESDGGGRGATAIGVDDRPIPVGRAWGSEPEVAEVATAIETPAEELEPDPPTEETDSLRVPSGPEVTSEMSLEQIRRDLEVRMAREKTEKK